MFLVSTNKTIDNISPIARGIFCKNGSRTAVKSIAHPKKVKMPNSIFADGKITKVTILTKAPQAKITAPRRYGWLLNKKQKTEIRIKLQQINCCHTNPAVPSYHVHSRSKKELPFHFNQYYCMRRCILFSMIILKQKCSPFIDA